MANRIYNKQSEHDGAVRAAGQIYRDHGKHAWINPDGEKNKDWGGRYIDIIAAANQQATSAWVIEVETDDSVNDTEAGLQWEDYSKVYSQRWYLAVPSSSKAEAERLLKKHGITNCTVITWTRNQNGTYTFWGIPGL
jgi:hypothetical protein